MMNITNLVKLYEGGMSVSQIAETSDVSPATIYRAVKKAGVGRNQSESIKLAISQGRGAAKLVGRSRNMTDEQKQKLFRASAEARRKKARGWRTTSQGYQEYTIWPHAGKMLHRVVMEARLGRRLKADEDVHHIDGDKTNNEDNNLALVTKSGHQRLHRFQEAISGKIRSRTKNGRFKKETTQ